MATKISKIQYAILNNPMLIPVLLRDTSINRGMILRKLHEALPFRIGIEFELADSFAKGFMEEHQLKAKKVSDIDKAISIYYNLLDVKSDEFSIRSRQSFASNLDVYTWDNADINTVSYEHLESKGKPDYPITEVRVSLKDYTQLRGLYKFMQDMPKYCKLHENGGIHIHLDISEYPFHGTFKETEMQRYILKHLKEIQAFLPKYKGKYNKKKVGIRTKATWVNISRLNTLEVRILPLTFDYSQLMSWIVKLVKFRQSVVHNCHLSHGKASKGKKAKGNSASINEYCTPDQLNEYVDSTINNMTQMIQADRHSVETAGRHLNQDEIDHLNNLAVMDREEYLRTVEHSADVTTSVDTALMSDNSGEIVTSTTSNSTIRIRRGHAINQYTSDYNSTDERLYVTPDGTIIAYT